MLLERFRKNKNKDQFRGEIWPNITYTPSKINIVQHPWKTMSEKEQKMMYDLRYIYCDDKIKKPKKIEESYQTGKWKEINNQWTFVPDN